MIRPTIARVRLVTMTSEVETRTVTSEFPSLKVERAHAVRVDDAIIDADEWRRATSFTAFDETLARSRGDALMIRGDRHVEHVACEALTRYQRFVERRNGSSRTKVFDHILRAHRALCDGVATNEFDLALDTWQWMLRLDPAATLTAQLAALFYESERARMERPTLAAPPATARPMVDGPPSSTEELETLAIPSPPPTPRDLLEPYGLIPDGAPSQALRAPLHSEVSLRAARDRSASIASAAGAWTFDVLRTAGLEESIGERVREIVSGVERGHATRRGHDAEMDLLVDASSLAFLSLGSAGHLDAFGAEDTRRRLAEALSAMSDHARTKLSLVRLRPDVRALIQRSAAA